MRSFIGKKNMKGFTLIELLAVLVVLAIIALITIPIVINIISDSRANSNRRSVDNYGKALEYAISRYMNSNEAGNFPSYWNNDERFKAIEKFIDYKGRTIDCRVKNIYDNGTVYITDCYIANNDECVKSEDGKTCYFYATDSRFGTAGYYTSGYGTSGYGTSGWYGTSGYGTSGWYGTSGYGTSGWYGTW